MLAARPPDKWLVLLLVLLSVDLSPRLGTILADYLTSFVADSLSVHAFIWGSFHHIAQVLPVLILMMLWKNRTMRDWGFRTGNFREGLRFTVWFTIVWTLLYILISLMMIVTRGEPTAYYNVQDPVGLTGELLYRFLIVGPSEEILFRSFPLTLLIIYWNKSINIFRFKVSSAGFIAAGLFAYAHIQYSLFPLEVRYFDPLQIFTAFGLGLFYALIFERTKSILYPALIHSISDVIPVLSLWVLTYF